MKFAIAAAVLAIVSTQASAQTTANFEKVGDGATVPNGYAGVDWSNFSAISNSVFPQSGYAYGVVSGSRYAGLKRPLSNVAKFT